MNSPSQNEVVEEAPTVADFPCATPGPWRAHMPVINGKVDPIYWYIEGGAGYGYASLGAKGFCLSGYIHEADARLMAAAPDLLNALRRLLATTCRGTAAEHEPGCGCVIHEAERAIASASQQSTAE